MCIRGLGRSRTRGFEPRRHLGTWLLLQSGNLFFLQDSGGWMALHVTGNKFNASLMREEMYQNKNRRGCENEVGPIKEVSKHI